MRQTIITFLILTILCSGIAGAAHRYHTSLTRIDYNTDEKSAEITIQIFTNDIEDALTKKMDGKASVHLDKTPKVDQLILNYLSERFVLKNKSGETKKMRWVGMESQNDMTLIYIETQMPEGFDGATLENSVLNDQFGDQINLVTARCNGAKTDLVFKTNDAAQILIKKTAQTNSSD